MNLFLLAAVPLAAVILHRVFFPSRPVLADPKSWILGSVWSVLALVAAAPLGKMREFDGNLWSASAGLFVTDAVLVPGAVVLAWVLTRPRRETWELGLWLALAFTMAGIRDFAATSRTFDLTEYFLVPLDHILVMAALPLTITAALQAPGPVKATAFWTLSAVLLATGFVVPVLSWGGQGWLVWLLVAGGLAGTFWAHKKAVPPGNGFSEGSNPA